MATKLQPLTCSATNLKPSRLSRPGCWEIRSGRTLFVRPDGPDRAVRSARGRVDRGLRPASRPNSAPCPHHTPPCALGLTRAMTPESPGPAWVTQASLFPSPDTPPDARRLGVFEGPFCIFSTPCLARLASRLPSGHQRMLPSVRARPPSRRRHGLWRAPHHRAACTAEQESGCRRARCSGASCIAARERLQLSSCRLGAAAAAAASRLGRMYPSVSVAAGASPVRPGECARDAGQTRSFR